MVGTHGTGAELTPTVPPVTIRVRIGSMHGCTWYFRLPVSKVSIPLQDTAIPEWESKVGDKLESAS